MAVIVEQSWPFAAAPVLIDLAKSLAADPEALSKLSMDRTTAAYKMQFGVAKSFHKRTIDITKKHKFSLNLDEATGKSSTARVLTILVNFVDPVSTKVTTQHLVSLELIKLILRVSTMLSKHSLIATKSHGRTA